MGLTSYVFVVDGKSDGLELAFKDGTSVGRALGGDEVCLVGISDGRSEGLEVGEFVG